jgi:hypothetical protein
VQAVRQAVESHISHRGYVIGYAGGILMTLIAVAVAFLNAAAPTATKREQDEASNRSGRFVLIIVGIWWFSFSLLTFFRLGAYPGPSLPSIRAYLTLPWTRLFETFRYIVELPNLGRFLILYFIFSDGYSVIGSVSVSPFFSMLLSWLLRLKVSGHSNRLILPCSLASSLLLTKSACQHRILFSCLLRHRRFHSSELPFLKGSASGFKTVAVTPHHALSLSSSLSI